jgi:hypothetical protein
VELLPFVLFGVAFVATGILIVWGNGRPVRRSRRAFRTWALQRGHDLDEQSGRVTGRGESPFVAELQHRYEFGDGRMVPVMTFPGPFALPESEFRHRGLFGLSATVHRISGLTPFTAEGEAFRARTHDLWSTEVSFLEDVWARGIHDILAGPTEPLSYRITPDGRLEVYCLSGVLDAWTETALSDAEEAGSRLSRLLLTMTRR